VKVNSVQVNPIFKSLSESQLEGGGLSRFTIKNLEGWGTPRKEWKCNR